MEAFALAWTVARTRAANVKGYILKLKWLIVTSLATLACTNDFDSFVFGQNETDGGPPVLADGSMPTPTQDSSSGMDTAVPRGVDAQMPMMDAAGCPDLTTTGTLNAFAASAIVIDGDLTDWGCPPFNLLTPSNAQLVVPRPNGVAITNTAQFAVRWDSAALYFAAHVTVANPGGNDNVNPYQNDAVEFLVSGDSKPNGDYTSVDHQYIVDWKNLSTDYGPYPTRQHGTNPTGFTTSAKVGSGGYVVEAKMLAAELGVGSFAVGQSYGFDFNIDTGNGDTQSHGSVTWTITSHGPGMCTSAKCCAKTPANDQPYCDTLLFGHVKLM